MNKKLSFFVAALLMGLTFNASARAVDFDDEDDAEVVMQQPGDDDAFAGCWFRSGSRPGIRGMGHGPAMRPGMPGPDGQCPMMGSRGRGQGMPGMMGHGRHGMGGKGMRGGMGGMRGGMGMGFGMPMMHDLELTEGQKTQFVDAMTDAFRQRMVMRMERNELHRKLGEEMQSATPNRDNIIALNKALGELDGKQAVLMHENQEKFENILTPEQREKLKEQKENIEKMREERGPGKGSRPSRNPRLMRGPGPRM